MERIRFFEYRGVRVLAANFSGITDSQELRIAVDQATALIHAEEPESVLSLVDLSGVPYSMENVAILRRAVVQNKPFVRARAVVGLPPVAHLSYGALAHLSGRPVRSFDDVGSGLEWLSEFA